jgi:hypothetical protein
MNSFYSLRLLDSVLLGKEHVDFVLKLGELRKNPNQKKRPWALFHPQKKPRCAITLR